MKNLNKIKTILYIVVLIIMILTNRVIAVDFSKSGDITENGIFACGILIISIIAMIFAIVAARKNLKETRKDRIALFVIIGVVYYILCLDFEATALALIMNIIIYYVIFGISHLIINANLNLDKYDDYMELHCCRGGGLILVSRLMKKILNFFWQNKNLKIENIESEERFEKKYDLCKTINILVVIILGFDAFVKGFESKYIETFYRNSIYIIAIVGLLISFIYNSKRTRKIGYTLGMILGSIYTIQALFNLINIDDNKIYMGILLIIGIITIKNNIEFKKYLTNINEGNII